MLAILSSFMLILLQGYWLYNSISFSMGEIEKDNRDKAEATVAAYLTRVGNDVRRKPHIGYVVSARFSDYSWGYITTVCSPTNADTIVGGFVKRKPAFRNVIEHRDTFDLREIDSNHSCDCLNTYITYQMIKYNPAHFDQYMSRTLGERFVEARMKVRPHRFWIATIRQSASLFHHEMMVEVPFNPIMRQSMEIKMKVKMQPILQGMIWQIIGSLLVTVLLLLSFAYLMKVMLLQKRVDKMRSDFVHTMIHELKRPVQTLKMCVSVFSGFSEKDARKVDAEESRMIMDTVREESDNLTAYLSKLREVIRAEEHIPLRLSSFDIHAELSRLATFYQKDKTKEVNISLDYQRSSDRMMGDKEQLVNVVSNLLENSVKYSGDIVNISITCKDTPNGEVSICVSDNGIGISQEELSQVWQKFYRSQSYSNMMQPGIGLGLSFVDMIVKAHGGTKRIDSEVDKGTKITINIPQ